MIKPKRELLLRSPAGHPSQISDGDISETLGGKKTLQSGPDFLIGLHRVRRRGPERDFTVEHLADASLGHVGGPARREARRR